MRIDLLLSALCLTKTRSQAKNLCDADAVLINGNRVRASATVVAGDRVTLLYRPEPVSIVVHTIPGADQPARRVQVSKADAVNYYDRIETPRDENPWKDTNE